MHYMSLHLLLHALHAQLQDNALHANYLMYYMSITQCFTCKLHAYDMELHEFYVHCLQPIHPA